MKPTHRIAALAALTSSLCALAGTAAAEDVQVKFWSLKNPGFAEFVELAKASFAEKHPDVAIVFEDFPNEAYKTAIQVALTGSDGPDAFYNWVGEDSARFVRDGLALDISDYGKEADGFQSVLSDGWLSAMTYDDKLYGVPVEAVSKFFYYSVPYFEKHDLEVPTSFDGVIETCKAIRGIDPDTVPLPLGNSERWKVNHYITMLNERVLGHEQTTDDYDLSAADDELFADPGFVTAWEKLLQMQAAGCFQDAPNATSPEISRAMFSAGASPMIYCGSWCAGIFDGDGFTDYGMFRMPAMADGTGDASTNFVLVQGYQVSAKTEHPEETVAWLSHLVSAETALAFAETQQRLPSNPELLESSDSFSGQFKWIAADVSSVSAPINVLDVLLENSVSEAYLDAGVEILNGTMTPDEAMAKIRDTALEAKAKL